MKVALRRLDDDADRSDFDCGVEALNGWLRHQAGQAQRKRLASIWIAILPDEPTRIVGYYSLAPWQIAFEESPPALRKRLPRYPLAVSLVARLAVDRRHQGSGLGGVLVVDAISRARIASETVPAQAVVVHAKSERAAAWYQAYGFLPFRARPLHLYLPMETIAHSLRVK